MYLYFLAFEDLIEQSTICMEASKSLSSGPSWQNKNYDLYFDSDEVQLRHQTAVNDKTKQLISRLTVSGFLNPFLVPPTRRRLFPPTKFSFHYLYKPVKH